MAVKITSSYVHFKDFKIEDTSVAAYLGRFKDDEAELEDKIRQAMRIGVETLKDERLLTLIRRMEDETGARLEEIKSRVLGAESVAATKRGFNFEEVVGRELGRIASVFGDDLEKTGGHPGSVPNSKVGDFVIKINPRDTSGLDLKIVFECKTQKGYAKKDIAAEISSAKANRKAAAGVMVFDIESAPSETGVFHAYQDGVVCAVDPALDAFPALDLAYRAARYEAFSNVKTAGVKVRFDAKNYRNLVEKAAARLKEISGIKKNVTSIIRVAGDITSSLDSLNNDLRDIIAELDECVKEAI